MVSSLLRTSAINLSHVCTRVSADNKLAAAVEVERERALAVESKLEEAEAAARDASAVARAAAEGEAKGRRAAGDLAELAREQKVVRGLERGVSERVEGRKKVLRALKGC